MMVDLIRIGLVDDEEYALDILSEMIKDIPGFEVMFSVSDPEKVAKCCSNRQPDAIIVDVNIPGHSGIVLSKWAAEKKIPIILTSGYPVDAREAYGVRALDFLSKPVTVSKLLTALSKVPKRDMQQRTGRLGMSNSFIPSKLFVRANRGDSYIKLRIEEIWYIKGADNFSDIITEKGKFLSSSFLSELARMLIGTPIQRVHKSYLVNMDKVHRISPRYMELIDKGFQIPIGKTYWPTIQEYTKSNLL
ncbi:LytR/AlgR family response regulator transcription factor [Echinicola sediminis]